MIFPASLGSSHGADDDTATPVDSPCLIARFWMIYQKKLGARNLHQELREPKLWNGINSSQIFLWFSGTWTTSMRSLCSNSMEVSVSSWGYPQFSSFFFLILMDFPYENHSARVAARNPSGLLCRTRGQKRKRLGQELQESSAEIGSGLAKPGFCSVPDSWGSPIFFKNGLQHVITYTGWWFGTMEFYGFPYIGKNHPNWRTHIFQRGWNHQALITVVTNQLRLVGWSSELWPTSARTGPIQQPMSRHRWQHEICRWQILCADKTQRYANVGYIIVTL